MSSQRPSPSLQSPLRVKISNRQSTIPIHPRDLKQGVRAALALGTCKRAKIHVRIVDDAESQALNRRFLQHDYPTDVITFPLEHADDYLEADLLLSAETAARCAAELGVDVADELLLYAVHGVLHLLGFDDHTAEEARAMRRSECEVFNRLGKSPPRGRGDEPL